MLLFWLGPVQLPSGWEKVGALLTALGTDLGPRQMVSARGGEGNSWYKTKITEREKQEPKSCPECREFTGMRKDADNVQNRQWMGQPPSPPLLYSLWTRKPPLPNRQWQALRQYWPPHFWLTVNLRDHSACVWEHVCAVQLKRKSGDWTNQWLPIHNKFLSIYLFIFPLATKGATANLQRAVVARGWIMAILIWLCKSSEEPQARYRNIS